mgnify:CR=1 FL=1
MDKQLAIKSKLMKFEAVALFAGVRAEIESERWQYFREARKQDFPYSLAQNISAYRASLNFTYVYQDISTIVYLERDELNRLENLDLSNRPYLDRVRDVFVFACYCGLRFSDIQRLEISQIYGKALHVVTKKTNNPVSIELNSHTTRILGKYYDGESLNKKALPTISNQKTNSYLRKICKLAGIDAPIKLVYYKGNDRIEEVMPKYEAITFHASRRTFITMALLLEVPIPVIMQWSGHRNQSALKPYMQVVNELRKKQMSKFDLL